MKLEYKIPLLKSQNTTIKDNIDRAIDLGINSVRLEIRSLLYGKTHNNSKLKEHIKRVNFSSSTYKVTFTYNDIIIQVYIQVHFSENLNFVNTKVFKINVIGSKDIREKLNKNFK